MLALSPLIFFIIIYLVTSIVTGDFYKVPISVAFMFTAVFAIIVSHGKMNHRLKVFGLGAGRKNIMLMIWIFILAGAFANSAREMGSVQEFVNLILSVVPPNALMVGLFLSSALISLSIGTSVGTIVALVPIAVGLAQMSGNNIIPDIDGYPDNLYGVTMMTAIVVGGAFFGDNLSFISDTTVVATQTQGCSMSDKFRTNVYIALPAAFLIMFLYAFMGTRTIGPSNSFTFTFSYINILKVIPYLVVLVSAILGINVLMVLTIGLILCGIIGLCTGAYSDIFVWFDAISKGILGMGELIIVTLLAGGILEVIRANGGIRYIINKALKHIHTKRGAEFAIAVMVSLIDCCTANNTVAIITMGGISREISQRFNLDPRRVASILDTFSCIMQGIIPYGAQLLMAAALAKCNPISIIPYLYYPYALLVMATLAIIFQFPRRTLTSKP